MKLLLVHADHISYKPTRKALKYAEEVKKEEREVKDVLVSFVCAEKQDEESIEEVAKQSAKEIIQKLHEVKAKSVLLYPYAHLSSDLANPSIANSIVQNIFNLMKQKGINVHVAPFGWYKEFELKCKGHPLAESFKEVNPKPMEKVKHPKKDKFHRWILMDVDGKTYEVTPKNWRKCKLWKKGKRYELLKFFVRNEIEGKPGKAKPPKHVEYMRRLELVDYCPESDVGHFKLFPNGMLIKDLMMDYALNCIALPWGAMKIQNPLLYRRDVPEIQRLHGEFLERDYSWKEGKVPMILRFASDPGAFPFMRKVVFSYRHMPVKIYEEAICFRKELKGELTGLSRVRNFWMTDQHAFCASEEQAMKEYAELSILFAKLMNQVIAKRYWVLGFEIVEEFYERYVNYFKRLIKRIRVPAFFKLMKEMTHYYAFKNEYQAIFPDGDNLQISTVQWDVKNGKRFDICYVDEKGRRIPVPIIVHASSIGSVERALATLLETAAWMEKEGKAPVLPLWLSPEQVRLIPVSSERHLPKCQAIAKKLSEAQIRVGIDDRELTVAKKVFEAKRSWINYIIVIGDAELKAKKFPVVVRERSGVEKEYRKQMELRELIEEIKRKCKGMPFRPLYVPPQLSSRVIFVPWGER